MLRAIIFLTIGGSFVLLIYGVMFSSSSNFTRIVLPCAVIAFQAAAYHFALRRGHVERVARLEILVLSAASLYGCYISGGVYASFTLICFIPLMLSATMLDRTFTLFLTGLFIITFLGLLLIELSGALPYAPFKELPFRMVILIGGILVTTIILLYHMSKMSDAEKQMVNLHTVAERFRVHQKLTVDLAHDLRTPVTALRASVYLLRKRSEKGLDIQDKITVLEHQITNLHSMIEGLMELSVLDAMTAEPPTHFALVDLAAVLQEVHSQFADYGRENKQITLSAELGRDPVRVIGDEGYLNRIFVNLISNGISYGVKEGSLKIVLYKEASSAVVKVIDNGIGIPSEDHAKIFERFYRVNEARTTGANTGTGIGLHVVKRLVELHKGTVGVESVPGQGSTFTVTLPLAAT